MSRQALGKGLDALLKQTREMVENPVSAIQGSGNQVAKIAVSKIVPNRFQPRRVFNDEWCMTRAWINMKLWWGNGVFAPASWPG